MSEDEVRQCAEESSKRAAVIWQRMCELGADTATDPHVKHFFTSFVDHGPWSEFGALTHKTGCWPTNTDELAWHVYGQLAKYAGWERTAFSASLKLTPAAKAKRDLRTCMKTIQERVPDVWQSLVNLEGSVERAS